MRDAKACDASLMKHGRADRNRGEKNRRAFVEADNGSLRRQPGMNTEAGEGNECCERNKKGGEGGGETTMC